MVERGGEVPAPAIVQGDPVHHIAQVIFDTDADPHGLYAEVRLTPALRGATARYLSEKGSGGILYPMVFTENAAVVGAFAKRVEEDLTEHRRETILHAVAHLVGNLDSIARATGPWAQFADPNIEVFPSQVADEL